MSVKANYTVTGMTCGHCELSVQEEISEIPGVTAVEVDRPNNLVTVISDDTIDPATVVAAVEEAGYNATPIDA